MAWKRLLRVAEFTVALGCLAGSALAQPRIDSITGILQPGNTITLTGSSFGTKATPGPVLYDTIENIPAYGAAADGQAVPVVSDGDCPDCPWGTYGYGARPVFETDPAKTRVPGRPTYMVPRKGYFRGRNPSANVSENGQVYISWWYRANHKLYDSPGGTVFNKLLRFTAGNSSSDWEEQIEVESQNSYGTRNGCGADGWGWFGSYPESAPNVWNHVELYVTGGGNLAAGTGRADVFFNGVRVSGTSSLYSCHGMLDHIYVWGADPNTPNSYPSTSEIQFGEMYMDTSAARIVVTNVSNYTRANSSPVHWEIQKPITWSDNEISFELNQGSFSTTAGLYAYVLTADGSVSQPISLDGTVIPEGPGVPGIPEVIN